MYMSSSCTQIPLSDAMKAKARLTIGGGRDFDNGRVSLPASEAERQLILYPIHRYYSA